MPREINPGRRGGGNVLYPWIVAKEYLWGVPVALSRSFVNHGLILGAVELLKPDEIRTLRFLLLPKDIFGKIFNAILPLTFDKIYEYRLRVIPSIGIAGLVITFSVLWYGAGEFVLGFSRDVLFTYIFYLLLNIFVYSVLPITWRTVYRSRAVLVTIVVSIASAATAIMFYLLKPESVNGILLSMSFFSLSYIAGMLLVARQESETRPN